MRPELHFDAPAAPRAARFDRFRAPLPARHLTLLASWD
jgi:hypothetical protein